MGNVHMEATQINYRGGSKKMSVEEAIKAAGTEITPEEKTWIDSIPALASSNAGKTDQDVIAPEFDAEAGVYAIGDLVIYQGGLYKFTTAHETAGAWNPEEVAAVKVSEELSSLESGLMNKQNELSLGVMIDNLNNAGVGCCNYDENATNAPDTATGIVITFRNTWNNMVFGVQIAYTRGTPQKAYIRHEWNGGYGNWKEISIT